MVAHLEKLWRLPPASFLQGRGSAKSLLSRERCQVVNISFDRPTKRPQQATLSMGSSQNQFATIKQLCIADVGFSRVLPTLAVHSSASGQCIQCHPLDYTKLYLGPSPKKRPRWPQCQTNQPLGLVDLETRHKKTTQGTTGGLSNSHQKPTRARYPSTNSW